MSIYDAYHHACAEAARAELAAARAAASEGDIQRERLADELCGAELELRKMIREAHDEFNELEKHNRAHVERLMSTRRSWEALEHRLEAHECKCQVWEGHQVKTEEPR